VWRKLLADNRKFDARSLVMYEDSAGGTSVAGRDEVRRAMDFHAALSLLRHGGVKRTARSHKYHHGVAGLGVAAGKVRVMVWCPVDKSQQRACPLGTMGIMQHGKSFKGGINGTI
jgi:hypothetical protein